MKANKLRLRDILKESQLESGDLVSEDMLIRSQRDSQCNIVPFLQNMNKNDQSALSLFAQSLDEFKIRFDGQQSRAEVTLG